MYMQEGTPHQNFLGTQQRVLEYEVERKKIKDISAFVIANGVVFRYFFKERIAHQQRQRRKVADHVARERKYKMMNAIPDFSA